MIITTMVILALIALIISVVLFHHNGDIEDIKTDISDLFFDNESLKNDVESLREDFVKNHKEKTK